MSLDTSKLNKRKEHDGKTVAQCPACAENGADNTGNHLVVFDDGKFGCVAYPGDHLHRRRIWAIVGGHSPSREHTRTEKRIAVPVGRVIPQFVAKGAKSSIHGTARTPNSNTCIDSKVVSESVVDGSDKRISIQKCRPSRPTVWSFSTTKIDPEDYEAHVRWSKNLSKLENET